MPKIYRLAFGAFCLLFGVVSIGLSVYISWHFYRLSFDFAVQGSYRDCEEPLHNRCDTHWLVMDAQQRKKEFVPLGDEIPKEELAEGNRLQKQENSFHYRVNGNEKQWRYHANKIASALFGFALVLLGGRVISYGSRRS